MKHSIKTYAYLLAILCIVLGGNVDAQQDTITKEVMVIKAYDPTIEDAFKMNAMPGIPTPPPANKTFTYSVSEHTFNPPTTISPLPAEPFTETEKYALYQNYISGGIGNYTSFYGDLYYNAYTSKEYQLDVYGTHHSSFGKVKLEDGSKSYAPFSKNKLGLGYTKRFKNMELHSDLVFNYNANRFYGYQTVKDSALYQYAGNASGMDTLAIPGTEISAFDRQHFSDFHITAQLNSIHTRKDDFTHKSFFQAYSLGDNFTNRESFINLGTDILFPLVENFAGLDAEIGFLFYNNPSKILPFRTLDKNNIISLKLTPYYYIENDLWKLKLGFSAQMVAEQSQEVKFVPSPDIRFDLELIEDFLMFYGKLSGSYDVYSYKQLGAENPFIAPNMMAAPVQTPIDFKIGLRGTVLFGFDIHVSTGFGSVKNKYFFVNETYRDIATDELVQSNLFEMVFDNGTFFSFDGELVYHGTERLKVGLTANYKKYTLENLKYAWHVPQFTLGAYGGYRVNDKITAKVLYQVRSSVKAQNADGSSKSLKAINDISLEGNYVINDRFTAFLKVNNVLAQKYYLWNGYPSQGINAFIGATYNF